MKAIIAIAKFIFPFVGWRYTACDHHGFPCAEPTVWEVEAFEVEWFGIGFTFLASPETKRRKMIQEKVKWQRIRK